MANWSENIAEGLVKGVSKLIRICVILGGLYFLVKIIPSSPDHNSVTKIADATLQELTAHIALGVGVAYFLVRLFLDD